MFYIYSDNIWVHILHQQGKLSASKYFVRVIHSSKKNEANGHKLIVEDEYFLYSCNWQYSKLCIYERMI